MQLAHLEVNRCSWPVSEWDAGRRREPRKSRALECDSKPAAHQSAPRVLPPCRVSILLGLWGTDPVCQAANRQVDRGDRQHVPLLPRGTSGGALQDEGRTFRSPVAAQQGLERLQRRPGAALGAGRLHRQPGSGARGPVGCLKCRPCPGPPQAGAGDRGVAGPAVKPRALPFCSGAAQSAPAAAVRTLIRIPSQDPELYCDEAGRDASTPPPAEHLPAAPRAESAPASTSGRAWDSLHLGWRFAAPTELAAMIGCADARNCLTRTSAFRLARPVRPCPCQRPSRPQCAAWPGSTSPANGSWCCSRTTWACARPPRGSRRPATVS